MIKNGKSTNLRITRHVLVLIAGIMAFPAMVQAIGPFTISGNVYKLESPLTALSGVTVKAYKGLTSTVVASTTTNASGAYSLSVTVAVDDQDRFIIWTKDGRATIQRRYETLDGNKTVSLWMSQHYSDPPTVANYGNYGAVEEICFKHNDTYYKGAEASSMARIYHENTNFVASHACSNLTKATSGTPAQKLANRVTHVHHRYNYASGPTPPGWGSGGGLPTWPTAAEGKAYWDWMYASFDDDGGSASMTTNCVSYAFDGLDSGQIQVNYWVDSQDWGGSPQVNKLWAALSTGVYPDGVHTFVNCPISDGDVAGTSGHLWRLYDPASGKAAQTAKWKNAGSGEYVWNHSGDCTNKAPKAVATGETTVVANKLWSYSDHSNPYYTDGKIKRE